MDDKFIPATIKLKYLPLNLEGKTKEEIEELQSLCEMINDSAFHFSHNEGDDE